MRAWIGCLMTATLLLCTAIAQQPSAGQKVTQPKTSAPKEGKQVAQPKTSESKEGQKATTQKPAQPKPPQKPAAKQPTAKQAPAKQPAAAKFTPPQLPTLPDPNKVVATVNGEPIRASELMRATYDWFGASALEEIIVERIIEQEARKQKVSVKPEEVEARYKQQLQNAEANMPPGMSLDDFLRRNMFPPSRLYARVRAQLLAEKLAEKRINLDDFIEYSEIVVRIQGANPEEQEKNAPAAEAKAQEAYQKIGEGLDFAEAAKQYSEDPFTKDRGGKKGWQHKRFLTPDVLAAAGKAQTGTGIAPLPHTGGLHHCATGAYRLPSTGRRTAAAPPASGANGAGRVYARAAKQSENHQHHRQAPHTRTDDGRSTSANSPPTRWATTTTTPPASITEATRATQTARATAAIQGATAA
jgi:foldase protein PrsA